MPFTKHTLSFQEKLKDKDSVYPSGMFDTNKDNALLSDGTDIVNTVATPTLSRGASLTVEKKWNGDSEEIRPESIKVTLLRDGEDYDTPRILLIQDKIGLLPIHIQIQAFRTHKFRMILIQITEIWVLLQQEIAKP